MYYTVCYFTGIFSIFSGPSLANLLSILYVLVKILLPDNAQMKKA